MNMKRSKSKKLAKLRRRVKRLAPPRTGKQYFAKPARFQKLWDKVVSVISKMRAEGTSLKSTSRELKVSPQTVLRYGGSALRKGSRGRYQAKKSDNLLRILPLPAPGGTREIAVRSFSEASILGRDWNAVQTYLDTGDKSGLATFQGKFVTDASGTKVPLLTDLNELDRQGSAGVLSFESFYGRTA
jgi:hypothetical protein